ncbi:MAG: hypothetical protein JW944_04300 [Deltaproteobacteria bacterium]|nr:hypothetical protein [Deltaproteobacteria bacterium]
MEQRKFKKNNRVRAAMTIMALMALPFVTSCGSKVPETANEMTEASVIDRFNKPDAIAKPMARMWFGEASAGVDDNDTIAKQINALAKAGYGGVEVAMLADDSNYTNAQSDYAGWGTPSWVSLLKKIYTAANAVEGGFIVDLTITSHWPPCLNTIDPNDNAASQEVSLAMTKLISDMLAAGKARLNLPETRTADSHGAHFIFTDSLTTAAVAKVTGIKDKTVIVDFATLKTLDTEKVTVDDASDLEEGTYKKIDGKYYLGSAAGAPDEETCKKYGWIYSSEEEDNKWMTLSKSTVGVFGEAPEKDADLSASYNGKEDASFKRARMADWQYLYAADVSGLGISGANNYSEIAAGDWVIIGAFCRGTGQMYSGRNGEENKQPTMLNRPYVSNYFDNIGIDVVADYWDKYILSDAELVNMMKVNGAMGASIFEDSIEAAAGTNFWVFDIVDEIKSHYGSDYKYADELPIVIAGFSDNEAAGQMMAMGFGGEQKKDDVLEFSNVDKTVIKRIEQDYFTLMGKLYNEQHCHVSNEWAESIGYSYRAQTYSLTGMDIAAAAASVAIPEGESGQNGDGHRQMRSAVNLYDKQCLSMEAITGAKIYDFNWEDVLFALTSNFSFGINHVIMHGSAYSKSLKGAGADWPGWDPFRGSFGEPYTYRQIYWEKMPLVTDYVARIQAIMQAGTAKVDVAVLVDNTAVFSSGRGNTFPTLLDNGYSYNILSESLLMSENAQKTGRKVIYADGPAYKAIVLENITCLSAKGMQQLIKYAKDGISIVSMNSNPSIVYGTEKGNETDANVAALYQEMLAYDCVAVCNTEDQLADALQKLGIYPYARYKIAGLEASLYQDDIDGSNYYYLYNDTGITAGMLTAASAKKYKVDTAYNRALTDQVITLTGSGTPYFLEPLTGEIKQAGEYIDNGDGTVSIVLDELKAACCKIVVITKNTAEFPAPGVYVTSVNADKADYDIVRMDGKLVLRSAVVGDYVVTLSNGKEKTVTISENGRTVDLSRDDVRLVIDSYGPTYPNASDMIDEMGIQTVDPSATTVIKVDFGSMPLTDWEAISATPEQLGRMGVGSMKDVSGKGYYTLNFDWDGSDAYLMPEYGNDQVTGIIVNGTEVAAIDNMTDKIDLGGMLKAGENTIEIELSSTLAGRGTIESDVLSDRGLNFGGTTYKDNGLSYVKLVSYKNSPI